MSKKTDEKDDGEITTPNPAQNAADVIDNPANTALEVAEEVTEQIEEVIEEQPAQENPIEAGISSINKRLDGLEAIVKDALKPKTQEAQTNATEPTTQTQEGTPNPGGSRRKGGRIKLFRSGRK